MRATLYGPGAVASDRTVLSTTGLLTVTPSTLNTWPVRVPVPAGAGLGLFVANVGLACALVGTDAADSLSAAVADPSTTSVFTPATAFAAVRLNLSAVWEPDADGDGYGDVSQDLCPQSKLIQVACPAPDTTVTKKPKKSTTNRKAKIKFASTIAGSTFTCKVDKKAAKPCTSPFKKKFKYGKHTVVITATSAVGIVDPTPVTVKFKVKKPKN